MQDSLINLTPARRGTRVLLCLPYAGGGSSAFFAWPQRLPADVEVWSVRLPGRESRIGEPPFRDLNALVEVLAHEARELTTRPYTIFGHSMGALVGYELARHLPNEPACLIASGHSAPQHVSTTGPLHLLPDDELIAALRGYGATPEALLGQPELMELFLPTLRADFAVVETYTHTPATPLGCPIAVFTGTEDADVAPHTKAWAELTTGTFSEHVFPGGHFFLDEVRDDVLTRVSELLPRRRKAA